MQKKNDQTEARSQDLLGKIVNNVNELILYVSSRHWADVFDAAYMW